MVSAAETLHASAFFLFSKNSVIVAFGNIQISAQWVVRRPAMEPCWGHREMIGVDRITVLHADGYSTLRPDGEWGISCLDYFWELPHSVAIERKSSLNCLFVLFGSWEQSPFFWSFLINSFYDSHTGKNTGRRTFSPFCTFWNQKEFTLREQIHMITKIQVVLNCT